MLKLNIGSSMLSIVQGSKCEQGKGPPPLPSMPLGPRPVLSMHELSLTCLSRPEPMLSLSMMILAAHSLAALEGTNRNPNQN